MTSYSRCFLRSSRESKPLRLREGEGGGSDRCLEGACSTATGGGIWLVPDARCSFPMGGAGIINDVWRIGELAPMNVENTGPFAAGDSEAACSSDVSTTSVSSAETDGSVVGSSVETDVRSKISCSMVVTILAVTTESNSFTPFCSKISKVVNNSQASLISCGGRRVSISLKRQWCFLPRLFVNVATN